jgi:hypothetical protein
LLSCPPSCLPFPAAESGKLQVTLGFVQGMLQAFKEEQLIHRRYAFEIILQVGACVAWGRWSVWLASVWGRGGEGERAMLVNKVAVARHW